MLSSLDSVPLVRLDAFANVNGTVSAKQLGLPPRAITIFSAPPPAVQMRLSHMLGRVSFCWTLLFLTGVDSKVRSWPVMAFIFLQVTISCVGIIVFYAQCGGDLDAVWNAEQQLRYEEYCWDPKNKTRYGYFTGAFNTVLVECIANLLEHTFTLSVRKKIGVALLLCMSLFATVASVIKTYEAKALSEVTDYSYHFAMYVIALAVELNMVIITASIPFLRSLFHASSRLNHQNHQHHNHHRHRSPSQPKPWERHNIPLGIISDRIPKTLSRISTTKLLPLDSVESCCEEGRFEDSRDEAREPRSSEILVTREVHVSFDNLDAPHVHAALVGLMQGEMAKPGLVRAQVALRG